MYYRGEYCKATDMYSLGCILFLAFTREHFDKDNFYLLDNLDVDVKYIITELLSYNYKNRPTIYDLSYYLT